MNCDRRCEDPRDPMYDADNEPDCSTCPGRDAGPTARSNVVHATFGAIGHLESGMADAVRAAVFEYAGRVSVAQAIGVLESVKAEILADAL